MPLPQPLSEFEQTSINPFDDDDDHGTSRRNHQRSCSLVKLRNIPPIPIRRSRTMEEMRDNNIGKGDIKGKEDYGINNGGKVDTSQDPADPGKKVSWNQSKSLRAQAPLDVGLEEMQSPRFRAIMRVTSGRKKKVLDINSYSHELNSKGVRPLPLWKPRAYGHMEEIMGMLKEKFEKLKEEVNSDFGIFAGDLVGILEETSASHPDWDESLEDLLIVARKCAKMTSNEFWLKCESIVQTLDDHRQELPMGILKQVHTRLLFILTRCTRLVQFHKECGYEESHHILGLHQLSDIGAYAETVRESLYQNFSIGNTEVTEAQPDKVHQGAQELDQAKINLDSTAKDVPSSASKRMASCKTLPSPAERCHKDHNAVDIPSKDLSDHLELKDEHVFDLDTAVFSSETTSKVRKDTFGYSGEQHHVTYESSLICRICEVEIPTIHVEQHSRICTIADRCDLKGLSVNDRLDRVAETLERIIDSWTPKGADTEVGSQERGRVSSSIASEDLDKLSPNKHRLSCHCSGDLLECVHQADPSFIAESYHSLPDVTCSMHGTSIPIVGPKALSAGCMTPRSPLLTPQTNQIDVFLSGRKIISEHEDCLQAVYLQREYI